MTEELRVLASADELQSLRVDYLIRFAELGILGSKVCAAGSCFPESFATIKSLLDKRAAFGMFLKSTVRERWSEMECADFDANLEDGRCMLFWAESVLETARRLHATALGEKADALQAMCPPKDKLDDPEILTSKEKQQLLFNNPDREKLNPGVKELTPLLQLVKSAQSEGFPVVKEFKDAYRAANAARTLAKLAIMLDWALDNIVNDPKTKPKDIRDQSQAITDMSKTVGVQLPEYFQALLRKMKAIEDAA